MTNQDSDSAMRTLERSVNDLAEEMDDLAKARIYGDASDLLGQTARRLRAMLSES